MRWTGDTREGWYWCFTHNRVEPADGCPDADRLGPYPTEADAADWRRHVAERNAAADEDEGD